VVCAVHCRERLLDCRLCDQLNEIRALEERLNGPGDLVEGLGLPEKVSSLYDLEYWHKRNVVTLQARVDRIKGVIAASEKPSATLGDVLESNGNLIDDTQKVIATDPLKAVFDLFMTLLPRHWAMRPDDLSSKIDEKYIEICACPAEPPTEEASEKAREQRVGRTDDSECSETKPEEKKCNCDEGTPDNCCGPDVGIQNVRQRLIGSLPYLVDPKKLPDVICCLTKHRLRPASDLLAAAEAELAAVTAEIEQAKKTLDEKTMSAIEAAFRAGLPVPFDCAPYTKKCDESTTPPPPLRQGDDCPSDMKQTDQKRQDAKDQAR
jgi:hypothetical protein